MKRQYSIGSPPNVGTSICARLELKCEAVVALAVVVLAGFAATEYLAYCDFVPAVDVAIH